MDNLKEKLEEIEEKPKSFKYQKLTRKICIKSAWAFFIIYLILWLPNYVLSGGERGGYSLFAGAAAFGLFLSLLMSGILYRVEKYKEKKKPQI